MPEHQPSRERSMLKTKAKLDEQLSQDRPRDSFESKTQRTSLLVLLCFDNQRCRAIKSALGADHFMEPHYKEIAARVYRHIDKYGEAPGENGLALLLADKLTPKKKLKKRRTARMYESLLNDLWDTYPRVNKQLTMERLSFWLRLDSTKRGVISAACLTSAPRGQIEGFS
jgi:hypothetical protein